MLYEISIYPLPTHKNAFIGIHWHIRSYVPVRMQSRMYTHTEHIYIHSDHKDNAYLYAHTMQ